MSTTDRVIHRVLPRHFVSARHGTRRSLPGGDLASWHPYGVQHARTVGSQLTACGISAVEWPIFWEMAFPREPESSCEDCLVALGVGDQRRNFADLAGGVR